MDNITFSSMSMPFQFLLLISRFWLRICVSCGKLCKQKSAYRTLVTALQKKKLNLIFLMPQIRWWVENIPCSGSRNTLLCWRIRCCQRRSTSWSSCTHICSCGIACIAVWSSRHHAITFRRHNTTWRSCRDKLAIGILLICYSGNLWRYRGSFSFIIDCGFIN